MRFFIHFHVFRAIFPGLCLLTACQFLTACGDDTAGPAGNPDAELVLLEPKGGESFHVGDSLRIRWKAQGKGLEEINSATVQLSPDSGSTWIQLKNGSIGTGDEQWGNFAWKIPSEMDVRDTTFTFAGMDKVLIRVQDYADISDPDKTATTTRPIAIGH
jgi:hypothetical protein